MEKKLFVPFWGKQSGNALSHKGGLTKEQVEGLKNLKEGDRLILFVNNKDERESETSPHYNLKVYEKRDTEGGL